MADSYRPLATPCEEAVLTQKHQQLALSPSVVPVFTSIPTENIQRGTCCQGLVCQKFKME